jgi:anaerobic ribonucleoside-triphosphate reductase
MQAENSSRTPCQIYTRVMGYHRPVSSFNIGKKSEFYSRKYFKELGGNRDFIQKYGS